MNGPTTAAEFTYPSGVAVDPFNGNVIVADANNNVIRLINVTSNNVSTLAGVPGSSGGFLNGPTTSALFLNPYGIAIDPFNGNIIVGDQGNNVIRLINITSNMVSTLAGIPGTAGALDGPISSAQFGTPDGIAIDPFNGNIIVADSFNSIIRLINVTSNMVSTITGVPYLGGYQDGPTTSAVIYIPYDVAVDPFNGNIIFTDTYNSVIRLINVTSNMVSTIAGVPTVPGFLDGPATSAQFNYPYGVTIDPSNGNIVVADAGNNVIRLINITSNMVSTLSGNSFVGYVDGTEELAEFSLPFAVAINPLNENIIVSDANNNVVRSICYPETYFIDSDSDGYGSTTSTLLCQGIALDGISTNSLDCNDHVSYIHPGQQEICNSIDDNCNDLTDEGVKTTYYEDVNGKLELNVTIQACSPPPGYVMFSSSLLGHSSQGQQQQLHSSNHHSSSQGQQQGHHSSIQHHSSNHKQSSLNSANRLEGFRTILFASFFLLYFLLF